MPYKNKKKQKKYLADWKDENRKKYNKYLKEYMREYRKAKK